MTPAPPSTAILRILLVLLLSLHALSSALILPTLPLLPALADSGARKWAFSALILGFGSTQLIWGYAADRWGRRPALLAGLLLFVLASVGCFFAANLAALIACRWTQGAGVAAAGVCARAIIRDLYSPQQSIVALSRCFSWISAISMAGPFAGGMLVARHGVPGALGAYGLVGVLTLAVAAFGLRETLDAGAAAPSPERGWRDIWRHPVFRVYTALTACSYLGHYLFLSGSAFLLIEQCGLSMIEYGAVLSLCSLVYLTGTVVCRRALRAYGVRKTICWASLLGLAGGSAMGLFALLGVRSAATVIAPYMLFVLAHAIHQSCGQAAAMAPFKWAAGRASAWLGMTLPLVAVCAGFLLELGAGKLASALPMAVFGSALLTATVAWVWVRRDGEIAQY
jgi:DHA1 family bicyclomycin/chloramphenicol resistance-like MFS transporter